MNEIRRLLEKEAYRFDFFQAIRLLESVYKDRPGVGHTGPFEQEALHIYPSVDLCFSPADISHVECHETSDGNQLWNLYENFIGLYGPNYAAPIFIAEMIAQCPDDNDGLRDFLDIFNHRILSLYYRAWKKHNLAACVSSDRDDPISALLSALVGRDVQAPAEDWIIGPDRLLRYSSYFSCTSRPASGLENLLSDYFELENVSVIQFVARKFKAETKECCRISSKNGFGRLGESFVLGDTIDDVLGQFKIRFGSLEMQQFQRFQPGEPAFKELVFLTDLYIKHQLDFYLELVLKPNQGKPLTISGTNPNGALGRSAWIGYPTEKETIVTFDAAIR